MGLFKIINKVIEVSYRLDLLLKVKIHLVYYNNNISLLNIWYGFCTAHADYSIIGEKLIIYRKKNPIVRGGKTL